MKMTLRKRLALVAGIPFVGVILLAALAINSFYGEMKRTEEEGTRIREVSNLAVMISEAVHELQRERGRSLGYLGSDGTQFRRELRTQHADTQTAVDRLDDTIAGMDLTKLGYTFESHVVEAIHRRRDLEGLRREVLALERSASQTEAYYTELIRHFITVIQQMVHLTSSADILQNFASYGAIINLKENAGIERALLSNTFARDAFGPGIFTRAVAVVNSQRVHLDSFMVFATEEQKALYKQTVQGPDVDQVARWRESAFSKSVEGGFEISAAAWFERITGKIDLLKEVEDSLGEDVLKSSSALMSDASKKLTWVLLITFGTIFLAIAGSVSGTRSLTRLLRREILSIANGAEQNKVASLEVESASQNLADGASEQASSLEQTSASMEEITRLADQNLGQARETGEAAKTAARLAESGTGEIQDLRREVSLVSESSTDLSGSMERIRKSGDDVARVIKTIDEIAFQTNILALNAAVEAARAGDAGSGFAVVADEVRGLAQRAAEAAKESDGIIQASLEASRTGISANVRVSEQLQSVVHRSEKVEAEFAQIAACVIQVDKALEGIVAATTEQQTGFSEINSAVLQINNITQENAANAEEVASSAHQLREQADHANSAVETMRALVHY